MPTAVHHVAPRQATDRSALSSEPLGFGLDCTDHLLPFQCSTNVPMSIDWPTAVQFDGPVHDTPLSSLASKFVCGLGWIVHVLPSQCSTSGTPTSSLSSPPTAVQFDALT